MNPEEQKLQNLRNETETVGKVLGVLGVAHFEGRYAQDVAVAQMYVQGLYNALKAEVSKIEPLPLADPIKTVESKPGPVVADSVKASK